MSKETSKQMRISKSQYELLGQLTKKLNVSRIEILSNVIALAQFLVESNAVSVKSVTKDGKEKEVLLPMLLANSMKGDE